MKDEELAELGKERAADHYVVNYHCFLLGSLRVHWVAKVFVKVEKCDVVADAGEDVEHEA